METSNEKRRQMSWLLPLLIIYSVLIMGGIFLVFIESLGYIPALGLTQVHLGSYLAILREPSFYKSVFYAFYLAISASLISCVLGVAIAYRLTQFSNKRFLRRLLRYGLILPYLYMTFLTLMLFSRTGILSRLLYQLNVIEALDQFPQIIYGNAGIGTIIVFAMKGIPFVALYVLNVMEKIKGDYQQVASTLGATPLQRLRYVYLPLSANAIVWSTVIIFAYDMGAFEVPFLFSGTASMPLSVKLYGLYINPNIDKIPESMAATMILFLLGTVGAALYALVLKKVILWQTKW